MGSKQLLALAEILIRQARTGVIEVAVSWWGSEDVEGIIESVLEDKGHTATNVAKAGLISRVLAKIQANDDANIAYDYEAVRLLCEYEVDKAYKNPVYYQEVI